MDTPTALATTAAQIARALGALQAMPHHPKHLMATWEQGKAVLWTIKSGKGTQTAEHLASSSKDGGSDFDARWTAHQKMAWRQATRDLEPALERLSALALSSPGLARAASVAATGHRVGVATNGQGKHFLPVLGHMVPHGALLQHQGATGLGQRWAQAWQAGLLHLDGATLLLDPHDGRRRASLLPGHPAVWAPWLAPGVVAFCPGPASSTGPIASRPIESPPHDRHGAPDAPTASHPSALHPTDPYLWDSIDHHWSAMLGIARTMPWGAQVQVATLGADGAVDLSRMDARWPRLRRHAEGFLHSLLDAVPAIRPSAITPMPGFLLSVGTPHTANRQVGVIHLLGMPVRMCPDERPSARLRALAGLLPGPVACVEHTPYPTPLHQDRDQGQPPIYQHSSLDHHWQALMGKEPSSRMYARIPSTGSIAASFLSRKDMGPDNGPEKGLAANEKTPDLSLGMENWKEGYSTTSLFQGGFMSWADGEKAAEALLDKDRMAWGKGKLWTLPA